MPFNPNSPLCDEDKVRLKVGDIDPDNPILPDDVYTEALADNSGSVRRAAKQVATYLLFYLTRFTRERTGAIEVYGAEWATNYRKALEMFLKDPNLNSVPAMPYAGGISKSDIQANKDNCDNELLWKGGCKCDDEDSEYLRF